VDYGGLWFGLFMFGLPVAALAWLVYSRRGQLSWERQAEEAQREFEGRPAPPPRSALGRWAVAHPWMAVIGAGLPMASAYFALTVLGAGRSVGRALPFALLYGATWSTIALQYVRRRRGGVESRGREM